MLGEESDEPPYECCEYDRNRTQAMSENLNILSLVIVLLHSLCI